MKKATRKIVEKFPLLEERLNDYENLFLSEQSLMKLDEVQATFLKLAWFFEAPDKEGFDLGHLYKRLDNDWLEFALELITDYFREDTYLIKHPSYCLVKNGSEYLSLSQFADYLSKEGLNYGRQKLNLYYDRGKVPNPDLFVGGVKYWSVSTVENFCEKEKVRLGI
jgi:protein involved in sex pheromone biosynthesis